MPRVLSLAAATMRDVTPVAAAGAAARAGFSAIGVRLDLDPLDEPDAGRLRRDLDGLGVRVHDVEVLRLGPSEDRRATRHLLAAAATLGAAHVLVVSDDPDRKRTTARLVDLASIADDLALGLALEPMRFTAVTTLRDALSIVHDVGHPQLGVLVDALHLARSGGAPGEVAAIDPARLAYLQLCDAPSVPPPGGTDALIHEARHERLLPGEGGLDLAGLVRACAPDTAISVEAPSDDLLASTNAVERAMRCFLALDAVLSGLGASQEGVDAGEPGRQGRPAPGRPDPGPHA